MQIAEKRKVPFVGNASPQFRGCLKKVSARSPYGRGSNPRKSDENWGFETGSFIGVLDKISAQLF